MAKRPDEGPRPEEEDGGGAVKSFLEHLEDFRWTLIKSCAAIGVGIVVCLAAGSFITHDILMRPLVKAEKFYRKQEHTITFQLGTNHLGVFHVDTNHPARALLGTNDSVTFQLVPVQVGTNLILGLQPESNPARPPPLFTLANFSPVGGFWVAFQVAIYGGIALASPFLIYFIIQFVLPALKIKERKYMGRGLVIGLGLFTSGVTFCYCILLPLALNASVKYSQWLGFAAFQWRAEEYISFVCKFMLGMGLGFEMPVVILILVKLGIVTYKGLAGFRRYMIVINLVLGAVLTTPEVLTQVMMALPLQVLYEISVWIAWYWDRRDRKREAQKNLMPTGD